MHCYAYHQRNEQALQLKQCRIRMQLNLLHHNRFILQFLYYVVIRKKLRFLLESVIDKHLGCVNHPPPLFSPSPLPLRNISMFSYEKCISYRAGLSVLNTTLYFIYEYQGHYMFDVLRLSVQARRQEFPEGGSSTRIASRAPRGRGSGGLERPPEAQGYLEQNPSI